MTQITIKKELEQIIIDIDSFILETPKTTIKGKPKKTHRNKEVKLKKINKILLKIAKKSKNHNDHFHPVNPFKIVEFKPVYRNYIIY